MLGDLPEGAALPNETELMSQYQVSRPTLREALRILETESAHLRQAGAGGGARVAHPDPSVAARHAATVLRIQGTTLADVFTARSIIEPAAVDLLVARAAPGPRRRRAAAPPARGVDGAVRYDAQRYALVAARFHEQVIELAGNKTLTLIGLILLDIVESHNQATFAAIDRGDEIVEHAQDDHATLIDMIEQGDDGARRTGASTCAGPRRLPSRRSAPTPRSASWSRSRPRRSVEVITTSVGGEARSPASPG